MAELCPTIFLKSSLPEMPTYTRGAFLKSVLGNTLVNIITRVAGALFILLAAAILEPYSIGYILIGLGLITLISAVSVLGAPSALNYFATICQIEDRLGELSDYLRKASISVLSLSGSLSLCIWLLSDFIAKAAYSSPEVAYFIRCAAVSIPIFTLSILATAVLQGLQRTIIAQFIQNSFWRISHVFLLLSIVLFGLPAQTFMVGIILVSILMLLWSVIEIRSIVAIRPTPAPSEERHRFIAYALNSWGSSLASLANSRADMVLLGVFVSISSLPIFAVAATLATLLLLSDNIMSLAFRPVATRLIASAEIEEFSELYRNIIRLNILVVAPLAIYIGVFADGIILTLFGEPFAGAVDLLHILLLGVMPRALMGPATAALYAVARDDLVRNIDLTTTMAYVPLFSGLAYLFGLEGAALASAIYGLTQHGLKNLMIRRFYSIPWISGPLDLVYVGAVLAIALGLFHLGQFIGISADLNWIVFFVPFVVLAGVTAWLTRTINLSELVWVTRQIKIQK